jgi:hypothetical protein
MALVGSPMNAVTAERAQARLTISQALFAIAGVVLGGMFTGIFFVVDKRQPGVVFWALLGLAAALLVYSFLAGGWGIEKLNSENPHFNRQAIAVLAGFIALATSLLFLGTEKEDQQARAIGQIQKDLGATGADVKRLKEDLAKAQQDQSARLVEIEKLHHEIEKLKQHLPQKTTQPSQTHR